MGKLVKTLHNIETNVLVWCMIIMGAVLFLQVIMRFVFSSPLEWAEELARYLQIWITFLGIGYGIRNGSHIGMNLVRDKMPKRMQYFIKVICQIAEMAVFIILIKYSLVFIEHQNVVSTAMRLPMKIVYIVIPIGAVIDIMYNVSGIIKMTKQEFGKEQRGC